jgi:putative flippase GtrA
MLKKIFAMAPARYLAIGGTCAAFNNAILIASDAAGIHYAISIALAFLFVLPISYLAHALWSFSAPASWSAFAHYVAGSISSLVVAGATVGIFRGGLMLPMTVAAPLATVVMALYNYLMTRWAVHRGNRRPRSTFAGL